MGTAKKHMTIKDKEDWTNLYEYVRLKIMGYDENQSLSKQMVLRLKGLTSNKFMANNNITDSANYSYELVLNTFKFCIIDIMKGFSNKSFNDEMHKFNYALAIVENNLNTVYIRMQNAKKAVIKTESIDVDNLTYSGAEYKRKTKKTPKKLDDLW